ncbi:MAG: hypothetical protein WAS27_03400 [Candidatus Saccharimonadales bacterium]
MTHPLSEPLSAQRHDEEDAVSLCPAHGTCVAPNACTTDCALQQAEKRYRL